MNLPVAFHFQIIFQGIAFADEDGSFQSISGLEAVWEKKVPEEITKEPATFVTTHPPLVLKRAVQDLNSSALTKWLSQCLYANDITIIPQATIQLLSNENDPYMVWTIKNIVPKSWKLGELHSEKNEVLIETIELYYQELYFGNLSTTI
jgi:phage tail-like protein